LNETYLKVVCKDNKFSYRYNIIETKNKKLFNGEFKLDDYLEPSNEEYMVELEQEDGKYIQDILIWCIKKFNSMEIDIRLSFNPKEKTITFIAIKDDKSITIFFETVYIS